MKTKGHYVVDPIAKQVSDAVLQIFARETHIILGKHVQRDPESGGVFRFLPGRSKQTLMNDIGTFMEHFIFCSRGVSFNLRITETDKAGVNMNITASVNAVLGKSLVERG